MKVHELIDLLETFPREAEVFVYDDNYSLAVDPAPSVVSREITKFGTSFYKPKDGYEKVVLLNAEGFDEDPPIN